MPFELLALLPGCPLACNAFISYGKLVTRRGNNSPTRWDEMRGRVAGIEPK